MRDRVARAGAAAVAVTTLTLISGCGHWPFHHSTPRPLPTANELVFSSGSGAPAQFSQYWKRNAVLVDLQGISGTGSVVVKAREGAQWPVRIAFRVSPGSVGELEIHGAQRLVLPITPSGTAPIDLQLSPGVYTAKTPELTVSWGPNPAPAG